MRIRHVLYFLNTASPVGTRPLRKQPVDFALQWDHHAVSPLVIPKTALPWRSHLFAVNIAIPATRIHRRDQPLFVKGEYQGNLNTFVGNGSPGLTGIDWFPAYPLTWQECSGVPRALGKKTHQFALRQLWSAGLVHHAEEPQDFGRQRTSARNIGITNRNNHTGGNANTCVPHKAGTTSDNALF